MEDTETDPQKETEDSDEEALSRFHNNLIHLNRIGFYEKHTFSFLTLTNACLFVAPGSRSHEDEKMSCFFLNPSISQNPCFSLELGPIRFHRMDLYPVSLGPQGEIRRGQSFLWKNQLVRNSIEDTQERMKNRLVNLLLCDCTMCSKNT